jgi:hypothetical protein
MEPLYAVSPDMPASRQPLVLVPTAVAGDAEVVLHPVEGLPGVLARLYRRDGDATLRRARLTAMLARPPEAGATRSAFAWPTALVEDATGRCRGCLVPDRGTGPVVTLADDLTLGDTPLAHRCRIGCDLAAAVAELHRLGHAVIDLTAQRVRLRSAPDSRDDTGSRIVLTGIDSFSIQGPQRQCHPGTLHPSPYLAPELLQDDTGPAPRTDYQQDRFALAVLLFQLLNHGLHPFQALPRDPAQAQALTLADNVRRQRYAYGRQPHPEVAPDPASIHERWDETTRTLFEQAFTRTDRPPASRWRDHLDTLRDAAPPPRPTRILAVAALLPLPRPSTAAPSPTPAPTSSPLPRQTSARPAWRPIALGAAGLVLAGTVGLALRPTAAPTSLADATATLAPTGAGTPAPPRLAPLPPGPAFPAIGADLRASMRRAAAVTHAADRDGIAARLDVLVAAATRAADTNRPAIAQTQGLAWATEPVHLRAIDAPERLNGDFARYYADWTRFPEPAREIRELAESTFRRARLAAAVRQLDTAFALAPDDPATLVQYTRYALKNRQTDVADVISLMGLGRGDTTQFRGALWLLRGAIDALENRPAQDVLGALWLAQAYFGTLDTYCDMLARLVETYGVALRPSVDEVTRRLQDSSGTALPAACSTSAGGTTTARS